MLQSVLYCEVRNLSHKSLISRGLLYREDRYNRKSVISRDLLHWEVHYGSSRYIGFAIWLVYREVPSITKLVIIEGFISWVCKGVKNILKVLIFLSNSLVPVTSVSGPVFCEAVDPLCLVQLKSPSFNWNHWQNPCWKSHGHIDPPEREHNECMQRTRNACLNTH